MSKRQASDDDYPAEASTDLESDTSFAPKRKPNRKAPKRARIMDDRSSEGSIHPRSLHSIREPATMRVALLKWYKTVENNRRMPWRKPYDPNLGPEGRSQRAYEVWVSEIMLQQTQVATVIPYYNRWMKKFPTIFDLANSTLDEVNALWKGLGYYSRASRLLQGAQKVVKDHAGILPDKARDLEAHVPGIGRYSAGAVSSIAHGERVPAVDGNVQRVMSRLLALYANPKAKPTLDILWAEASTLVETIDIPFGLNAQYPGDVNQALIELGSTICKVSDPKCDSCPLQKHCSAYEKVNKPDKHKLELTDIEDICHVCEPITSFEGVTMFPMRAERKKAREEVDIVNVVEWRSTMNPSSRHFLMVKRPERGLLAGLYEFPSFVDVSRNSSEENMTTEILSKLEINNHHLTRTATHSVGDVQHIFSHIKKTSKHKSKKAAVSLGDERINTKWVTLKEVGDMNMGTGVSKIWNLTRKLWE